MVSKTELAWKLRRTLNKLGVDVVPYRHARHPIARRLQLFSHHGVDLVLDVGANGGQYGQFLRRIGYAGDIISFEPLSSAFRALEQIAAADPRWKVRNRALGDREATMTLNVSENTESSSLLSMLPAHLAAHPESRYVGTEPVSVTTVAKVIDELPQSARLFLKVDTQGYERQVIAGAGNALARVCGVQLEMSIVPLYEGEMLLPEAVTFMAERGLTLMALEPGTSDRKTGQLLQVDGLFFRP